LTDKKSEQVGDFVIESFWDSRYGAHFLTAYAIFKDNKFFGSGIKTFRTECSKSNYASIKSKYVELRCNTHPHNIFYEIISDGGIFLFAYFLCLFFLP
jgi:O-antigen ligase